MKNATYSAADTTSPSVTTIPRPEPTEHDVPIEILFCGIVPGHEKVDEAFERLKSNVKYRFSIDIASLKSE